jgi:hypothetical protein
LIVCLFVCMDSNDPSVHSP